MILFLLSAPAHAADVIPAVAVDTQLYRAPLDASATLWTEDATFQSGFLARLGVGYMREPFVWIWQDTGERVPVVENALGLDLGASYGVGRVRAGVNVPLYPVASGASAEGGGGLGDLAVIVKGTALDEAKAPLGLAFEGRLTVPTATASAPLGTDGVTWEVVAIAHRRVGPLTLAMNAGQRGARAAPLENIDLSSAFLYRLGGGYALGERAGLSLDLAGQLTWGELGNAAGSPLEAVLGGWVRVGDPFTLRGGVGRGLTHGIGSPKARALVSLDWRPGPSEPRPEPRPASVARPVAVATPPPPRAAAQPPIVGGPSDLAPGIVHIRVTSAAGGPIDATWTFGSTPSIALPGGLGMARVAPGSWTVIIQAPGFAPQTRVAEVESSLTSSLQVVLEPALVSITAEKLLLGAPIEFDGSRIRASSFPVLAEIAVVLRAHPEINSIRIEGHTDSVGVAEDNLTLSGARAAAVLSWLVEKGLSSERFIAAGYGESRPVDWADTEAARAKNRRIEMVITARAEASAPP